MNHFGKKIHGIVFGRVIFEPKTYKNYNISKIVLKTKSYSVKLIFDVDLYGKIIARGHTFFEWRIFRFR